MNAAAGKVREFPWDRILATAFGLLRLSPKDVWSMTPREIELALSVLRTRGGQPPRRADLVALMQEFPDLPGKESRHG